MPLVLVIADIDGTEEKLIGTHIIVFLAEEMSSEGQHSVMVRQFAA